jgi:hypothetical protein
MIFVRSEFLLQCLHCDLQKARISGWDDKLRRNQRKNRSEDRAQHRLGANVNRK